ncbi:MAG TPA: type II toxin-antitoxin system HicA family toxin [Thermodesulfobacteriota bacterium]|nr:type II toxin-antitoxin system HicA family toxin [Thermodesulfobacteriota bacterium]
MKIKEIIEILEKEGWRLVRTRGSHRQYKHARNLKKYYNNSGGSYGRGVFKAPHRSP